MVFGLGFWVRGFLVSEVNVSRVRGFVVSRVRGLEGSRVRCFKDLMQRA